MDLSEDLRTPQRPANARLRGPVQDAVRRSARMSWAIARAGGHHVEVDAPDSPPLAVDDCGNALVSFARGAEDKPPGDAPMPVALVALWHGSHVLMAFNRFRLAWELPGGLIDPGETARQAAARELLEETNHAPQGQLCFVGFASFTLAPDDRAEYGALFTGQAADVSQLFQPNDEIAAIRWWDLRETLPGRLQPLDAHLAELSHYALTSTRHGTALG
ncbi:NUDIX hydrolase [Streptomyces sp. NPDC057806]|uniref:NUDIX hydrolase n=1 Tax=Streptomyces sp. NPDC057806 TaxID=3346255 RepID=UPI0036913C92